VSENPYCLIDEIDGFGFLTVDKIALKAGMSVGNGARVSAAVLFCLNDNEINNGHVYFYGKELIGIVLDQLSESAKKAEVSLVGAPDYEQVRKCVYSLEDEGRVEVRKGKVYSKQLLKAEQTIQQYL
jgi:exodeoxyribonuclease V alpha subunit